MGGTFPGQHPFLLDNAVDINNDMHAQYLPNTLSWEDESYDA